MGGKKSVVCTSAVFSSSTVHACVVALVIADQQTRVGMRAKAFKQVYERSGTDFCAAAGAACKFGQLYFGLHRKISPFP